MNIHPLKNVNKIILDKRGCLKRFSQGHFERMRELSEVLS